MFSAFRIARITALASAAAVFMAAPASAASIIVTPWVAPNAFGSPSYAGAVLNANTALFNGETSRGDPSSPTYFQADSDVRADQVIVTGFPSWLGRADPGAEFGSAFASELGNRMLFGLRIDGQGSQFSISQLSFVGDSNGPGTGLDFGFGAGSYNYSNDYWGIQKGADGTLFTSDDIFIKSGASTQLVDGLVGRGSGSSFAAYCSGCTVAQQQAAIYAAAVNHPTQFTGTYSLNGFSGSGTFNIAAVPEPATWAMLIVGFAAVGHSLRSARRKTSAGFAAA